MIAAVIVALAAIVALLVTLTEPGAIPRYAHHLAYHRAGGRHTAGRTPVSTTTTTPDDAGPFVARTA